MTRLTIAIDGPSGSGKSTVGKRVAKALGYLYIDTGAMYRAVAWQAGQAGVALDDEAALARLAEAMEIRLQGSNEETRVLVDGTDVSGEIRNPVVAQGASKVSAVPGVRRVLVRRQQEMGRAGGVVMDGRDIGTVVFPAAEVKIFLDASEAERVRRRHLEDLQRGLESDPAATLSEIRQRDERDRTRKDSPLVSASDAVYIDTSGRDIESVFREIMQIVTERQTEDVHRDR